MHLIYSYSQYPLDLLILSTSCRTGTWWSTIGSTASSNTYGLRYAHRSLAIFLIFLHFSHLFLIIDIIIIIIIVVIILHNNIIAIIVMILSLLLLLWLWWLLFILSFFITLSCLVLKVLFLLSSLPEWPQLLFVVVIVLSFSSSSFIFFSHLSITCYWLSHRSTPLRTVSIRPRLCSRRSTYLVRTRLFVTWLFTFPILAFLCTHSITINYTTSPFFFFNRKLPYCILW